MVDRFRFSDFLLVVASFGIAPFVGGMVGQLMEK
jgi:hypothetical protein